MELDGTAWNEKPRTRRGLLVVSGTGWNRKKLSNGAGDRNRTCDLRVTSALLYRLSYTGV